MFTKSIQGRFQLWLASLLICLLSGFGVTVYQLQRIHELNRIDEELGRRVAALSSAVRGPPWPSPFARGPGSPPPELQPDGPGFDDKPFPPPSDRPGPRPPGEDRDREFRFREGNFSSEATSLFNAAGTNNFYLAFWSSEGALVKRSTNAPPNLPCPERLAADTHLHTRMHDANREAFHFTEFGDCILAGRPMADYSSGMRRFTGLLFAVGGVVLAFGLGGGWWVAAQAIKPIAAISATAERIAAGDLSQRITNSDFGNELGRLAQVLNSTFARLDAAFARQEQFTADAAHELRTPISVVLTHAQNGLASGCANEEHREAFETCQRAARRMRRLTESLLGLARLDAAQETMLRTSFDLTQMVRECVELIRPLAAERGVKIYCESPPVDCMGERELLAQVAANLLTNAIDYNRDGGEVRVATGRDGGTVTLTVWNTGPGIAAEDLPHVFERFHRADKARTGAAGHSGLGLAIVRAIVQAHGGSIAAQSDLGSGTTFTVRLPG